MTDFDTYRSLCKIADALEIPVSVFSDPREARAQGLAIVATLDAAELLRLFTLLPDGSTRDKCIELGRALAHSSQ
jgi:hypothetical protein